MTAEEKLERFYLNVVGYKASFFTSSGRVTTTFYLNVVGYKLTFLRWSA